MTNESWIIWIEFTIYDEDRERAKIVCICCLNEEESRKKNKRRKHALQKSNKYQIDKIINQKFIGKTISMKEHAVQLLNILVNDW